jgi:hypothetical protein
MNLDVTKKTPPIRNITDDRIMRIKVASVKESLSPPEGLSRAYRKA